MNHSEIVSFLWGVADLIRDTFKRGKYQDVILPLTVLRRLDCVHHSSGVPNPKTEGAVAAAFLDITDPANETHDAAQWTGSYLPRLIGTCEWREFFGVYLRASGIDHVTYCLEQEVDAFAANLHAAERITPTDWRHSATVPPSWSQAVARPLWHTNIFQ